MAEPAYEHNGAPVARTQFYAVACDPRRHVAVEACAGAGKTWMLVSRIVRALLAGAEPHEVLAITFTRKAAGEMRQRLQEWLAQWSRADDATLDRELAARGLAPSAQARTALRGLYARLLAAGRPVQIRTFHSWFAALLGGAPMAILEQMGLPGNYDLLMDDQPAVAQVWRRFYAAVSRDPAARADFEAALACHGRSNTLKALEAALAKRVEFQRADAHGVLEASVQPFGARFPEFAALARPELALESPAARSRWHERARALGAEKNKTPQKAADAVVDAFACDDPVHRLVLLRKAFFVAGEDRLTAHLQKLAAAQEAEGELQRLCAARAQHEAWLHHGRMARLARVLLAEFAALKREQHWVDMSDVERGAQQMLSDPVLSGWVQEQLDQRVRHLLIDEFQDTNALQWQALHAWLAGYAGAGGDAPSLFVVGDPKQSIYRFRRAEPAVFQAAQRFIADVLGGDLLACDHTHRNAPAVLEAVNAVMGAAQREGLYAGFRPHTSESRAEGAVLALPQVPRPARAQGAGAGEGAGEGDLPAWRDSLTVPRETPEEKLASVEARQAAAWIAQQLDSGRDAGDIMVLARRRERLSALEAQLRALQIPTQQPEKTDLCEAPEVQDIAALLDVLVSPGHDLSLARALRSPLFACSDDDLVAMATRARSGGGHWLELLHRHDDWPPRLAAAAAALVRWQPWLDALPPHDALQAIYDDGDVLARFARCAPARLRPTVLANLRAVLGAALQVEGGRYLTPYALVRALKAGGLAGPALAATGVVRLLTVHGSKGLQAPVVLLLDTDAAPGRAETMGALCDWPAGQDAPRRFAFLASESAPPACCADALAEEQGARTREELNALYVAMTRAQQQLVVSSVAPLHPGPGSWWRRLQPLAVTVEAPAAPPAPAGDAAAAFVLPTLPAAAAPVAPLAAGRRPRDDGSAAARTGQAMHRLLEHWRAGAEGFAPARLRQVAHEFMLDPQELGTAVRTARRILEGDGAWAWDPAVVNWQNNEVELNFRGESLRLDRLVRRRDSGEWWILDYKSAARPEQQTALQAQLQRYREALAAAQPGTAIRAAFLTGAGRLVEVA